ncbi:MAG TPA: ATP-binding protein [Nannocystaceae bacterium]|nr:ATP-binding protein [Nannocystaceae bacterium]
MGTPLRALIIEDEESDCELLLRALRAGGFDVDYERVESQPEMASALANKTWDIVFSDYSLPEFDAPTALATLKASGLDLPFIIVSGTVDEQTAVESMRAGADDFMAKGKLLRLVPAVARELAEAQSRAERRKMQEQLLVSDRMASLGTLAAGVAHEINNPLAAVLANVELVLRELTDTLHRHRAGSTEPAPEAAARWMAHKIPEIIDSLRDAHDATMRVRDVSRDLKVFSRGDEMRRGPVDVRAVMESTLRIAHNEIRHRAKVIREYAEVPPVAANQTRLGQVFLNLVINAAQALPEGDASRHRITVMTKRGNGDRVIVEVRDTGPGIPEHVLQQIFNPFFTTKPIGQGTGLGLAICHRIVTGLGGEIEVDTRPGAGTVFRVALPIARDEAEPVEQAPSIVANGHGPRARILVIDDDALVGTALARILSRDHEVVTLTSARDAYDQLVRGATFEVIFCDILMPELTGIGLYEALLGVVPDMAGRMVFMTGGAFTPAAREFLDRVRQPKIDKPFDVNEIRTLVRELVR